MRKILEYIVPTILALTLQGLYIIMDGFFIGNSSGDIGLSAINLAWPIPATFIASAIGIGTGGSILYSQNIGSGNNINASKIICLTIKILLFTGFLYTTIFYFIYPYILTALGAENEVYTEAYKYLKIMVLGSTFQIMTTGSIPILRNVQLIIPATIISICSIFLNFTFNYIFIVKLNYGVQGAGMGTVIAQSTATTLILITLYRNRKKIIHLENENTHLKIETTKEIFYKILTLSLAPFGLSITPSLILVLTNFACLKYGSTEILASYSVISYITFPVQYILLGVGDGLQPLISISHGKGDIDYMNWVIKVAKKIGVFLSILTMTVTFIFRPTIANIFGLSQEAQIFFNEGILITLLGFPFVFFTKFKISVNNATGKNSIASKITYIEGLIIAPLLIFVLPIIFGITGIWLSYPLTSIAICTYIYIIS